MHLERPGVLPIRSAYGCAPRIFRGEALPTRHYVNEKAPEHVIEWFLWFFT